MASRSSLIGAVGVGRQASKDTPASTMFFIPSTSVGLNYNQNNQTTPPEIGGDFFLRNAYKASVMGGGDVGMVVRPNGFGNLLYMLAGVDTVQGVNGQPGAYSHVFTPFLPSAGVDLPWFTALKDASKLFGEQYLNTKMASLNVDIAKSSIITAQTSLVSTTPSTVAISGNQVNGFVENMDTSPVFQSCLATVSLAPEVLSPAQPNVTFQSKVERFSLSYSNNISQDEFSVGSFFLDDITLLQRTVQVSMDIIVRDTSFYSAVYLNGGSVPNSWSPTVYRGALNIVLNNANVIPGTTQPYSLAFNFPGLDFMMMPINLTGADLVRATISTQVTVGPTGSDRFSATLINGVASY